MTDTDAVLASAFKRTLCKHFCNYDKCSSRCPAFNINDESYKKDSIGHYLKEGKKREIRTGRQGEGYGVAHKGI